jgi:hypothetical protein
LRINGTFVPWPTLYVFQRQITEYKWNICSLAHALRFSAADTEYKWNICSLAHALRFSAADHGILVNFVQWKIQLVNETMTINVTAPSIGFQPLLRETVGVRPLQKKHWMPTFTNQSDHTTGMAPQASVSSIHEASIQIHLDSITIYHVLLLYYCACNLHASIGRV